MTTPPPPPDRSDVVAMFDQLLSGSISREAASTWAMRWVAADNAGIGDDALWEAMKDLGGIDLMHGEAYLYSGDDLREWRAALG